MLLLVCDNQHGGTGSSGGRSHRIWGRVQVRRRQGVKTFTNVHRCHALAFNVLLSVGSNRTRGHYEGVCGEGNRLVSFELAIILAWLGRFFSSLEAA